jgi:WD40 repeat protein
VPPAAGGQDPARDRTAPVDPGARRSIWERSARPAVGDRNLAGNGTTAAGPASPGSVWERTVPTAADSPFPEGSVTAPSGHRSARRPRRRRRRRFFVGTVLLALVVAAAAIVVTVARHGTPPVAPMLALADDSSIPGGVTSIAFSPGGNTLATADEDGTVYLWNIDTRRETATFPSAPSSQIATKLTSCVANTSSTPASSQGAPTSVAFSPDGTTLAIGYSNGNVALWTLVRPVMIRSLTCPLSSTGGVNSVAFDPTGRFLAAGDGNGSTYLIDLTDGRTYKVLTGPDSEIVSSVAFSQSGTLAVGDDNGNTYLWDPLTGGQALDTLKLSVTIAGGVSEVAFSPNGSMLACAYRNEGSIALWSASTYRHIATLTEPGGATVNSVAFSRDSGTLASGDANGRAYIWDVATAREQYYLDVPRLSIVGVSALAFSPRGQILATGEKDDNTYLWRY